MRLFFRSSTCIVQCTKRLFNNAVAQNTLVKSGKTRKVFHVKTLAAQSDLLINKKLQNNEVFKDTQWAAVREELININKGKEIIVDAQIYDLCFHYEKFDQALSYFKFLESNNYQLHLNTISTYLKTYFLRKIPITPEEEKEICRIYNNLRKQYPLMDSKTYTNCILALSLTKRWRESLELLKAIKEVDNPGKTTIATIVSTAIRNGDINLAWELINENVRKQTLDYSIYSEYFNYCKKHFKGDKLKEEVEKMLMFWGEYQLETPKHIVETYAQFFASIGYNTTITSISNSGHCKSCKHKLQETECSLENFKLLSSEILKKVIIGENVFCATSPQELKRYMLFIKGMQPYDVVIDGLNVAYGSGVARGSLKNILEVVEYFLKNGSKRILVIGKAYMNWWSNDDMKKLKEKAEVFLTKNISEDDPFLLHITLLSGPQTYFVSKDLMRQHKHKLVDISTMKLFKQWQLSRQYKHIGSPGKIKLLPPLPFQRISQKNENGWHIPYATYLGLEEPDLYSQSSNWICIKKI